MLLAIDPGYGRCGVAVFSDDEQLIHYDLIETTNKISFEQRLLIIYNYLHDCINKYQINEVVYEEPATISGRNGVLVPQVLGLINLLCAINKITPVKYSPTHVKRIVTGKGDADKTLVEDVVVIKYDLSRTRFKELFKDGRDDVYDAIGIGYSKILNKDGEITIIKTTKRKKK